MNPRAIAAGLTVALLAGCASGGSGTALLPGASSSADRGGNSDAASKKRHRVKGYAHIIIRRPKKKHRGRGADPHFVSSATLGAEFVVTSDTGGSITTDANLSPASPYCTTTSPPNVSSCTVPVSMPFGNDTITITTYAQAPSGGGFDPSTALAVGSQTQQVTLGGATPTINVYLSGVVDSIDAGPAFSSLPADGSASSEVFVINGRDFGNVNIKAGSKDPYSNPITAKLIEKGDGGASHSTLQLNGGTPSNKAVLTQSNDSLQLSFDGTGKPGYTAMVRFSANGAPDQTIEISPLYVTASQIQRHVLNLNGAGVPARTMTITETDAPSGTTYTLTRTGCTGIATANGLSGTGSTATFLAQGGATASSAGCVINVADSNSPTAPFVLPATNTPLAGHVIINGVTLEDWGTTGTGSELTIGPDRNLWIVQPPSQVLVVTPSGTGQMPTIQQTLTVPSGTGSPPPSSLNGITTGPDGAIWLTDSTNGGVDRINVSDNRTTNYPSNQGPTGIATASNGTMWIGSGQFATLVNLTVGGGFTPASASPSNTPTRIVQGADGAIWFTEGNNVGRYDPIGLGLQEIAVPSGGNAVDLCAEPNGDIWFTANSTSSNVYQITGTSGSYTVNPFNVALGANLRGIACGVDNAVWYADSANNDIGRISLNAGNNQTTYAIPDANFGAQFITVSQDGSLWYTSGNANLLGHITP